MELFFIFVFLLLNLASGMVEAILKTPIEAFRPISDYSRSKRPEKISLAQFYKTYYPVKSGLKILYQTGSSEDDLPYCKSKQICNKVDMYDMSRPWIERRCKCLGHRTCSSNLSPDDNHSIIEKTSLFKMCEPVKVLPKCRYFKDPTWTIFLAADSNATQQIVNCHCPKKSITYLMKIQKYATSSGAEGHQYHFACSPPSKIRCSRKEPCKWFSVRKRHENIDEVNSNVICQCAYGHACPRHHTDSGVLPGVTYPTEEIRTYDGYCMPETPPLLDTIAVGGQD